MHARLLTIPAALRRSLLIVSALCAVLALGAGSASAHDPGSCKLDLDQPRDVSDAASALCARSGGGPAAGREVNLAVIDTSNAGLAFDPYTCNPYYSTCAPPTGDLPPRPTKHVYLKLSKKCRVKNFSFRPRFSGGTVRWAKLHAGKRLVKRLTKGPFRFTVPVRTFKKGKKQKLKLTTLFTDGSAVVVHTSVKRCK